MVTVVENKAKTILRKQKRIESWFLSRYGMNLYRGCEHNCTYCDGRAEKYQVQGEFGREITVKTNALEILKRELDPARRRKLLLPGYILVGGGVGDSYQPVEEEFKLTRNVLELLEQHPFPVHLLTKSTLVERDIDILKRLNKKNGVIVSFSFSSAQDSISKIFEPGASTPTQRLNAIARLKKAGLACGVFLMPVIPFITDTADIIEDTVRKCHEAGVDFIIFGGMTLKDGRQKDYFYSVLRKHYPELVTDYEALYKGDKWGQATDKKYYHHCNGVFEATIRKYKIPKRIPARYFKDVLNENDLVVVILEHLDYMLKSLGRSSPYGYAAYSITQLKQPLSQMTHLQDIKGVGEKTESIIYEILDTGTCRYYERLLHYEY